MNKLSIITINFNDAIGLEQTIKSVINQTFKDVDFIIIDGGSSDGSTEIIKKYENSISYWISEKDKGVYDAMNKGVKVASGDYLLMLNAGDFLADSLILEKVFVHSNIAFTDILYGDVIWSISGNLVNHKFPDTLTFEYFRHHSLGHQAAFIKRSLHNVIGLYDEFLKIASDWKFFTIAICQHNASYTHISLPIAVCDRSGISCNPNNFEIIRQEKASVLNHYFSAFLPDYLQADYHHQVFNKLQSRISARMVKKLKLIKYKIFK